MKEDFCIISGYGRYNDSVGFRVGNMYYTGYFCGDFEATVEELSKRYEKTVFSKTLKKLNKLKVGSGFLGNYSQETLDYILWWSINKGFDNIAREAIVRGANFGKIRDKSSIERIMAKIV